MRLDLKWTSAKRVGSIVVGYRVLLTGILTPPRTPSLTQPSSLWATLAHTHTQIVHQNARRVHYRLPPQGVSTEALPSGLGWYSLNMKGVLPHKNYPDDRYLLCSI